MKNVSLKNVFKKISAGVLTLTVLLLVPLSTTAAGQEKAEDFVYLALGDSITHGTRLNELEKERYSALLCDDSHWCINEMNLAVDGLKSGELLKAIKYTEYCAENELKSIRDNDNYWTLERWETIYTADVITVGIGSNNLLGPLMGQVATALGVEYHAATLEEDIRNVFNSALNEGILTGGQKVLGYFNNLEKMLKSEEFIKTVNDGIEAFAVDWAEIIKRLKNMNPDAKIIAIDFYNPFYGVRIPKTISGFLGTSETDADLFDLGVYSEEFIGKLNEKINAHHNANSALYNLVSIYGDFEKAGMTNVDIKAYAFDPHPNKTGHEAIMADIFAAAAKIENINPIRPGEMDGDHRYSAADALMILQRVVGKIAQKDGDTRFYDISQNKEVGADDALMVLQYSVRIL